MDGPRTGGQPPGTPAGPRYSGGMKVQTLPTTLSLYLCAAVNDTINREGIDCPPSEVEHAERYSIAQGWVKSDSYTWEGMTVGCRLNKHLKEN